MFSSWTTAANDTVRDYAMGRIRELIQQATEGTAFDHDNILCQPIWSALRGLVGARAIWESIMSRPLDDFLLKIIDVFVAGIATGMEKSADHAHIPRVSGLEDIVRYFVCKVVQLQTTSKQFSDEYVTAMDVSNDDYDFFKATDSQMKKILQSVFQEVFRGLDEDLGERIHMFSLYDKKTATDLYPLACPFFVIFERLPFCSLVYTYRNWCPKNPTCSRF